MSKGAPRFSLRLDPSQRERWEAAAREWSRRPAQYLSGVCRDNRDRTADTLSEYIRWCVERDIWVRDELRKFQLAKQVGEEKRR